MDDKEQSNENKNDNEDKNKDDNEIKDDDDDDLEDGEIETDDDEPIFVGATEFSNNQNQKSIDKLDANDELTAVSSYKFNNDPTTKNNATITAGNSSKSSKINTDTDLTSIDKSINPNKYATDVPITATNKKSSKSKFVEDDWAENIENAIASALKKEGVILPKQSERERGSNISDDDENGGIMLDSDSRSRSKSSKKRKKRESDKKSKKKIKQHHDDLMTQNDEIDDYEMLCIRGGSPPPSTAPPTTIGQTHRHHHHHHSHSGPSQYYESDNSYTSYDSYDSLKYESASYKERRLTRKMKDRRRKGGNDRDESRKRGNDKRKRNEDREDGGVCIPNMRGFCNNDDCTRSHECRAQRKLELCKFYLMECCAKKDKCSYMHSDFPCKYYYLGMECIYRGGCKFSHGKPLTEQLRNILLKHIETAPKEILGNFRRISREHAMTLLNATHAKLCAEQGIENTLAPPTTTTSSAVTVNSNMNMPLGLSDQQQLHSSSSIPSLLDIVIKPPISSPRKDDKLSSNISKLEKQRKSRWCDTSGDNIPSMSTNPSLSLNANTTGLTSIPSRSPVSNSVPDILSLKNLTGVISAEQIEKLAAMGIQNLEQVNQLTVAQLNSLGLTISQINEIQLNALNIQKLGLIRSPRSSSPSVNVSSTATQSANYLGNLPSSSSGLSGASPSSSVASMSTVLSGRQLENTIEFVNPGGLYSDPSSVMGNQKNSTQDIDMRFLVGGTASTEKNGKRTPSPKTNLISTGIASPDAIQSIRTDNETMDISPVNVNSTGIIDYSQYLKDSNLDIEKTDLNDISLDRDDGLNEDEPGLLIDESWTDPNDDEKDTDLRYEIQKDNKGDTNQDDDDGKHKKSKTNKEEKINSIKEKLQALDSLNFQYDKKPLSYLQDNSNDDNWDTPDEDEDDDDDDEDDASSTSSKKFKQKPNITASSLFMNDADDRNSLLDVREFRDPRLNKPQQLKTTTSTVTSNNFSDYMNFPSTSSFATSSSSGGNNELIFGSYASNDNVLNENWMTSTLSSVNTVNFDNEINDTGGTRKYQRVSIYDANSGDMDDDNNTSTRNKCDKDMRMSSFIDSVNSDIDLRLPFKPVMTNYKPATEIDGSISTHNPIPYEVVEIDIPKPDYSEIRRNMPVSDKILDPRLRRIFRLTDSGELGSLQNDMQFSSTSRNASKRDDLNSSGNSSSMISAGPRVDPRRRKESQDNILGSGVSVNTGDNIQGVDIRLVLQKSNWYKNLNSTFKIMVHQQLALVKTELKKFHQDTSPHKVFDMTFIATNQCLQQILTNLCIYIDSNGQIKQLEGENDGDDTSTMPGMMGLGRMSGMDPTVAASNVQQIGNPGSNLMMQSALNGSSLLSALPRNATGGGMYMRCANSHLNVMQGSGAAGAGLMSQFRSPRYDIRPGLLGIAPGIQYNPYDSSNSNEMGDMAGGYMGGQADDQNNFNAFGGGSDSGGNGSSGGIANLFDQQNFLGRSGNSNLSSNNRGMRNNFRQSGSGSGGGNGGGRNQNDRWNTGSSGSSGSSNRDNNNSRRNYEGGKNISRRDKSQKL